MANTRKVSTKKSTAVLKDTVRAPTAVHSVPEIVHATNSKAPVPPVHKELQAQRSQESEESEPKLRRTRSKAAVNASLKQSAAEPLILELPSEEPAAVRSDGVYIDDHGQVRVYQFMEDVDHPRNCSVSTIADSVVLPPGMAPGPHDHSQEKDPNVASQPIDTQLPLSYDRKQQLVPLSEPEEYWDEEEDDENYVEDGYVTARSYRSRGENTTNGATTVLFPKMNQKTRKELANATALIDAAKAAGELDDETWDTTMVAEYGDEIFQYMRELEVITRRLPHKVSLIIYQG